MIRAFFSSKWLLMFSLGSFRRVPGHGSRRGPNPGHLQVFDIVRNFEAVGVN